MKNDPADAELQARFAALRRHDETLAPPFPATLSRARRTAGPWRHPAWLYGVAGAVLAAVLLDAFRAQPLHTQAEPDPVLPLSWRAPTDGLLNPAPGQVADLAWNALPTATLGRPTFSRYAEDR
jgi:hypothetical protein